MLFYALNGREPGSSKTTPADFDIKQNKIPEYHEESSQKQLVQLIEQSVEEELRRHKNVRLSLSAGYDASAILGACVSKGIRVRCFSYGSKNSPRNSDVEIARKMAQSTGMSHEIWPMDGYPAEEIQKSNSNWFEGVANRCGELGAWIYYQESLQPKEVDPPSSPLEMSALDGINRCSGGERTFCFQSEFSQFAKRSGNMSTREYGPSFRRLTWTRWTEFIVGPTIWKICTTKKTFCIFTSGCKKQFYLGGKTLLVGLVAQLRLCFQRRSLILSANCLDLKG